MVEIGSFVVAGLLLLGVGLTQDRGFITDFTVFILACIVGWQVIWNVTPALHTPLMSVTNAISGIIIVGGMVQVGVTSESASALGALAIFVATHQHRRRIFGDPSNAQDVSKVS